MQRMLVRFIYRFAVSETLFEDLMSARLVSVVGVVLGVPALLVMRLAVTMSVAVSLLMLRWMLLTGAMVVVYVIMLASSTRLQRTLLTWLVEMEAVLLVLVAPVVATICYVMRLNGENRRSGFSK